MSALPKHNAQSYTPEQCLLQPTFSTNVLLPENKTRLKTTKIRYNLEIVDMLYIPSLKTIIFSLARLTSVCDSVLCQFCSKIIHGPI